MNAGRRIRPDSIRERPRCRKVIIALGLRPWLDSAGCWDGRTALRPDGSQSWLTPGMRTQMRRMIAEGHWTETTGEKYPGEQN